MTVTATCATCDGPLEARVGGDGWPMWTTPAGEALGPAPGLPENPYETLNQLAARGPKDQAAVLAYSALSTRIEFLGTWHVHRPAEGSYDWRDLVDAGLVPHGPRFIA